MLVSLVQPSSKKVLAPLISGLNGYVVMGGVLAGLQRGCVYVDRPHAPTSALIWASHEMFYLIGRSDNADFNRLVRQTLVQKLLPEALDAGEDMFNLEVYPDSEWSPVLHHLLGVRLLKGLRVPFQFHLEKYEKWLERHPNAFSMPLGYTLQVIDRTLVLNDKSRIIEQEILKFWQSMDDFYQYGVGTCTMYEGEVVGICISVFVSGIHYETGIHTYLPIHRGKGLATAMASAYIRLVLNRAGIPHWTTEDFRKDSIVIAGKLGFEQLCPYPSYYLPIRELLNAASEV